MQGKILLYSVVLTGIGKIGCWNSVHFYWLLQYAIKAPLRDFRKIFIAKILFLNKNLTNISRFQHTEKNRKEGYI